MEVYSTHILWAAQCFMNVEDLDNLILRKLNFRRLCASQSNFHRNDSGPASDTVSRPHGCPSIKNNENKRLKLTML